MNGNEQPNDSKQVTHSRPDFNQLQAILEAFHEFLSWARSDSKENGFTIIDPSWSIYKPVSVCHSDYHILAILQAHGIDIAICDEENQMPIYEVTYTN